MQKREEKLKSTFTASRGINSQVLLIKYLLLSSQERTKHRVQLKVRPLLNINVHHSHITKRQKSLACWKRLPQESLRRARLHG